jgi:hypothetical protein
MTRIQKLTGIALIALTIGGGMGVALGAGRPHAAAVVRTADLSAHPCVEGTFEWRWNVAGATCEMKDEAN